jgi:hypothetical protein
LLAHGDTPGARDLLGAVATPDAGARIVAVFHGTDSRGEPLVAVGAMPLKRE